MSKESETSRPHVAAGNHHRLSITRLNPRDVLLGRESCFVYYVGNAVFRNELVRPRKEEYRAARFHEHKHAIAKEVYDEVYKSGGRFLDQAMHGLMRPTMGETVWYIVAQDVALQKIKQALREKCASDAIVSSSTKETLPVALKAPLQGTTGRRNAGNQPAQQEQQQQPHDPQVKAIQAAAVVVAVKPDLPVAATLTSSKHDTASANSSVPFVLANGTRNTTVRSLHPVAQPADVPTCGRAIQTVPRLPQLSVPLSSFAPTIPLPTDSVATTTAPIPAVHATCGRAFQTVPRLPQLRGPISSFAPTIPLPRDSLATTTAPTRSLPFGYPTQPAVSFPPIDQCSHDVMPINRQRIELNHLRHRLLQEQQLVHKQIMLRQMMRSQQQPALHRQQQNEIVPTFRNATNSTLGPASHSITFRKVAPNSILIAHHGLWNRALVATTVLPVALASSDATVNTTTCLSQTNDAILDGADSKPPARHGNKRARLNGQI